MDYQDVIAMQNARYFARDAAPNLRQGIVTLYAEYRNRDKGRGYYGGDAYPVVWTDARRRYGMILVADGMGNGNFEHPSLERYLEAHGASTDDEKLYVFLRDIFGEDFFADEEAVNYAAKSFAPIVPNGFYSEGGDEGQCNKPFYRKNSQYLSSRIVTVGIYHTFRDWFARGGKAVTPEAAAELRTAIDDYINVTLRGKINAIFDTADAPNVTALAIAYLPCTAVCWFFEDCGDKVNAVAYNVGDTRAYVVDTVDGVMQVTPDDAEPVTNVMTCIIRFGTVDPTRAMPDGAIKASYVQLDKPCALMCCSDGVYDTCPPTLPEGNDKIGLPATPYADEAHLTDAHDLAFEVNFLHLLRSSYSLDDVQQRTAKHIYLHVNETASGDKGVYSALSVGADKGAVKRDDSATMGMVLFGEDNGYELLSALRTAKTSLDKLVKRLAGSGEKYCYVYPTLDTDVATVRNARLRRLYETRGMKDVMKAFVREDVANALAEGKPLWGILPVSGPMSEAALTVFVSNNAQAVFLKLLEDVRAICKLDSKAAKEIAQHFAAIKEAVARIIEYDKVSLFCDLALRRQDTMAVKAAIEKGRNGVHDAIRKSRAGYDRILHDYSTALEGEDGEGTRQCVDTLEALQKENDDYRNALCAALDRVLEQVDDALDDMRRAYPLLESIRLDSKNLAADKSAMEKDVRQRRQEMVGRIEAQYTAIKAVFDQQIFAKDVKAGDDVLDKVQRLLDKAKVGVLGPQDNELPMTVFAPQIPDEWQQDEEQTLHILRSMERYERFDKAVTTVAKDARYTAATVERLVDETVADMVQEAQRMHAAYALYEKAAYAKRSDNPIARSKGFDENAAYKAVYRVKNRGLQSDATRVVPNKNVKKK